MTTTMIPARSPTPEITFSDVDRSDIVPHEDDPVVISIIAMERRVHRVLVDQGSSVDVMFWSAFQGLNIPLDQLRPFDGMLVGFSGDPVAVRGYVDLRTTFVADENEDASKTITIRFIVVQSPSSYNVLLGRPSLNRLEAIISTSHLKVKFPTTEGKIVTLKVDQATARKCYKNSLKMRRSTYTIAVSSEAVLPVAESQGSWKEHRPQPVGRTKQIEIGKGHVVKIGDDLDADTEQKLLDVIRSNSASFAWQPSNMVGIDPDFMSHKQNVNLTAKPKMQRRRKMSPEKLKAVRTETAKLLSVGHIREIQYPEWLANVVLVKKSNGKWCMCVDFTDLNNACPKDSYPLPNIDTLVDYASGRGMLSFLDAYSGYNQIAMHPADVDKTAFIGEASNYCYKVMPFGLKNAGATYQRLMDKILSPLIGRNVQVYVDDMVVTSTQPTDHSADLSELFTTINKYGLKLNPDKCVFGVRAGKFLGFLLTKRGIEANPDKCAAIINMRSPRNIKEV